VSSINHHFNPQVYLKRFTNPKVKNELWEYNLTSGSVEKSTPKDCGYEKYYNSVSLKDGGRDDETLETAFFPLENALPKIFKAIRNKQEMTNDLWSLFFTFVAIQDARSPSTVSVINDFLSQIYQADFEMMCKGSSKFQKEFTALGVDPLIRVQLEDSELVISGERKGESVSEGTEVHRQERYYGKFTRSISLPTGVKTDGVKAAYKDGILSVTLPKAEETKPKQIDVSVN
jgi:hypothetical protein